VTPTDRLTVTGLEPDTRVYGKRKYAAISRADVSYAEYFQPMEVVPMNISEKQDSLSDFIRSEFCRREGGGWTGLSGQGCPGRSLGVAGEGGADRIRVWHQGERVCLFTKYFSWVVYPLREPSTCNVFLGILVAGDRSLPHRAMRPRRHLSSSLTDKNYLAFAANRVERFSERHYGIVHGIWTPRWVAARDRSSRTCP